MLPKSCNIHSSAVWFFSHPTLKTFSVPSRSTGWSRCVWSRYVTENTVNYYWHRIMLPSDSVDKRISDQINGTIRKWKTFSSCPFFYDRKTIQWTLFVSPAAGLRDWKSSHALADLDTFGSSKDCEKQIRLWLLAGTPEVNSSDCSISSVHKT